MKFAYEELSEEQFLNLKVSRRKAMPKGCVGNEMRNLLVQLCDILVQYHHGLELQQSVIREYSNSRQLKTVKSG